MQKKLEDSGFDRKASYSNSGHPKEPDIEGNENYIFPFSIVQSEMPRVRYGTECLRWIY